MFLSKGYKGIYDLYFINSFTNKRTKVSTGKSILRDARKFRDEFQIDSFLYSGSRKITDLLNLKEEVLEYARTNMAKSTCDLYKKAITNLIIIIGNRQLSLIGMRDIERFKNVRLDSVSRTSVNMEVRTIKAIFNYAVKCGILKTNPAENVKQFRLPEKEKLSFSHQDLERIFSVITDPIIGRITLFALNTGCRLSEILNIQVKDINFDEKYITIRNKADFKTKSGKIRRIPFSEGSERLVNPYMGKSGDRYLFSFKGVIRLNKDYVSQKFKKYLRAAGLPEKFHFHCLRHTFITNLIKAGVSINFVKELAGHSDIQTTMGYVHIDLDDLNKAIKKLKMVI